ncbi:MAG: hypothetical protein A3E87_08650 [Gammaproteobacteria bacterium RIFCSPHIGHO2_12_FULL_35_23]|nr:MAG: hypothetical protein A3E87_08650 [Gammaproteobacteria bacterium RIFCSPHIGHO2_12_FULL_35_23]
MDKIWPFISHHWLLSALFILLLIAIFIFEALSKKQSSAHISPQETIQLINRHEAVVIDIRSREAFIRGHIINAIHLPFAALQKDIQKLIEHKHKPIVIVCEQGLESVKAAKLIEQNEFDHVSILQGGMKAWREEDLPLEKGK